MFKDYNLITQRQHSTFLDTFLLVTTYYFSTAPDYFTNTPVYYQLLLVPPRHKGAGPPRREISKLPVGEEALLQMELGQLDNLISL